MSYQVLARKWRPRTFSELVGQRHVLKALINTLQQQKLHHAYLFTGTRGVGKTTIARILAKALNCEKGVSSKPCLECQVCLDIEAGRFVDLIEIDAASKTRVEDTREILDNVLYTPTVGRYKVYLIDEVHMLSTHSFNALLKTLEEPPPYVKFLLATTDSHKIPQTVLSRCINFRLKHLLVDEMVDKLEEVCLAEQVNIEPAALPLLAKAGQGSMRDSLSLLDQAIAYGNGQLVVTDVRHMLGFSDDCVVFELLDGLCQDNASALMDLSRTLLKEGVNFVRVLDDLIDVLHQISIYQCVPNIELSYAREQLDPYCVHFNREDIQLFYQIALKGREDLEQLSAPVVGFEMTMLRMHTFKLSSTVGAASPKVEKKRSQASNNLKDKAPVTSFNEEVLSKTIPENLSKPIALKLDKKKSVVSKPIKTNQKKAETRSWSDIVTNLRLSGMAQTLLSHCVLIEKVDNKLVLGLASSYQAMLTDSLRHRIEAALSKYYGEQIGAIFSVLAAGGGEKTPAELKQEEKVLQQIQAKQAIEVDPCVEAIVGQLDGKVISDSIKSMDKEL